MSRRNRITLVCAVIGVLIGGALGLRWARERVRQQARTNPLVEKLFSRVTRGAAWSSTDKLINALQERLRIKSTDAQALVQLGDVYLQKARETGDPTYYTKAEGVLRKALDLQPQRDDAMSVMGTLCLARHQFREALDWGQRAQKMNLYSARAYGVIGDAYVELGEYPNAAETIQRMVNLRPDLSSYSRVSHVRELFGDVEGAIQAMKSAVAAGGPAAENTQWCRVQLGHLYFNSGQLDEAVAEYQQAVATLPNYVHALAGLARVLAARKDYEGAIILYTKAVESVPLPEYVIALGDVYQAAGQTAKAAQQYELVRAMEQLYRANGVEMDMEMALFDADHQSRLPEAVARARRAMAQRPSIYAADVLAWTLYKSGQPREALDASRKALRLGTKDALLLFHAGMICERLGDVEQARMYLDQCLSINPQFSVRHADTAGRTLARLRGRSKSSVSLRK
ncbi:MAG: tetratricopeptide repeat protein [Candidatus Latescibacteria bacterium]|nr:tetratricopeptide repeat protein [Candidatus Latescibacterota bacterium]